MPAVYASWSAYLVISYLPEVCGYGRWRVFLYMI